MLSPSELLWWLVQPSTVVFLMLLLGALLLLGGLYRSGRRLVLFALLLALLPALLPIRDALALPLERLIEPPTSLPDEVDGILVLGGSVEWEVSQGRRQLNLNRAGERMLAAAALSRRYPDATLVLTGLYRDTLEGEFSNTWTPQSLISGPEYARGRTLFIGASRSTYEDALLSLEAARPQRGETWLLVTSAMHMPRALGVFSAVGWHVVPFPVDFVTTGEIASVEEFEPFRALVDLDTVVREWGALLVYRMLGRTTSLLPEAYINL